MIYQFIGLQEWDVQCKCPGCLRAELKLKWTRIIGIGEADWEFKTTFDVAETELNAPNADLVFDGLDTFATVTLVR